MSVYTKKTLLTAVTREDIGFAHKDAKGREIGCVVFRSMVEFEVEADARNGGYRMAPGVYYQIEVQATRNGENYGASQPRHYFSGEVAAHTYVAKRIEDGRKAAAKKAGK